MKLPDDFTLVKSSIASVIQVDDDEVLTNIVSKFHAKSELKNPFITFTSGDVFLDHLLTLKASQKELPLIVLLDINMPGMDGFEVLEKLRSDEYFKDVPLCSMLTSSAHPEDISRSKSLGADGYLVKPDNARTYMEFFNDIHQKIL